jgi:hypothetical protein
MAAVKEEKEQKYGTKLKKCKCQSQFQDEKYGPGIRVCNVGLKESTCTVCETKHK